MVEQTAVNRSVVGSSPTVPASTSMAHVASGQRGEVFKPLTRIFESFNYHRHSNYNTSTQYYCPRVICG